MTSNSNTEHPAGIVSAWRMGPREDENEVEEQQQDEHSEHPYNDDYVNDDVGHNQAQADVDDDDENNNNEDENDNDNNNDDDDNVDQEDEDEEKYMSESHAAEENTTSSRKIAVGGVIDAPAFALLAGVAEDPKTKEKTKVSFPVRNLPATIGRSHDDASPNFVGIGNAKAISREQCVIELRHVKGFRIRNFLHTNEGKSEGIPDFEANAKFLEAYKSERKTKYNVYFALTCKGKNKMSVDGKKLLSGEVTTLINGSIIRFSNYYLYFLLPTDAKRVTIEIPNPDFKVKRKRKAPTGPDAGSLAAVSAAPPGKKPHGSAALITELDALPVEVLLARMTEAIEANLWERRHQMVGSTISYHAVLAAARAPEIKKLAERGTGVARTEIMEWIQASPKFATWVDQMNSKMEPKSYQSSITKALLKAGFIRTGLTGRYVKWYLPKDIDGSSGSGDGGGNEETQTTKDDEDEEEEEVEDEAGNDHDDEEGNLGDDGSNEGGEDDGDDEPVDGQEPTKPHDSTMMGGVEDQDDGSDDERIIPF